MPVTSYQRLNRHLSPYPLNLNPEHAIRTTQYAIRTHPRPTLWGSGRHEDKKTFREFCGRRRDANAAARVHPEKRKINMPDVKTLILASVLLFMAAVCGAQEDHYGQKRREMVARQIEARGISDRHVLDAMEKVPRHLFVPEELRYAAYEDTPLPIGYDQTISQPYIVAYMTEAAGLGSGDVVLEIGTGSGYQAAVLAQMVKEVYTIEIIRPLADSARGKLEEMGIKNVHVRWGDGYAGWPEAAPFDAIIVTAAPPDIPQALVEQLKAGGRMVIPVGTFFQQIYLITRTGSGIDKKTMIPVRFVPMVKGGDTD